MVTPDEDSPLEYFGYDTSEQTTMNRPQPQAIRSSQYIHGGSYDSQRHDVPYKVREFDAVDENDSLIKKLINKNHKKNISHMQYYSNDETGQDDEEDIEPYEDYEENEDEDYDLEEEDQSLSYNVLANLDLAANEQMIARDQIALAAKEQMAVAAQLQMTAYNQMMAEQQLAEREQMALLKQMQQSSAQNLPFKKNVHATNGTEGASTEDNYSNYEESMEDMSEQLFQTKFSSTADSACATLLQFLQGQMQPRYMKHMSPA